MTRVARSNLVSIIAIAIVAYAFSDTAHELLGHGVVAVLCGFKVSAVSSVGLQSVESSRLLSASGSIVNVLIAIICFPALRRRSRFGASGYFLWLLGFVSAMNGTFYLVVSAVLNQGDWAVVIAGLHPAWAWRVLMGVVGLALYFVFLRWAVALIIRFIEDRNLDRGDVARLTVTAYVTGGVLMTMASVFNPFGRQLILMSGIGASFGLTWGLLLVAPIVESRTKNSGPSEHLGFSLQWTSLAIITAVLFVGVFGPGIRFR